MYAVIVTSGKQYKVTENDVLKVDKLEAEVGSVIQFEQVLALGGANGELRLGTPTVAGAKISAEVLEQKKDSKVIVFKKKRRHNYRRKNGHRQFVTVLRILDVSGKGSLEKKNPVKKISKVAEKTDSDQQAAASEKKTAKKATKATGSTKSPSSEGKAKSSDKKKTASKK